MKYIQISLIFFLLLIAFSCTNTNRYTDNPIILRAEGLVMSHPDSAYRLLTSIKQPEELSEKDYAAWCLHYSHACYRLKMDFDNDSMILKAVRYYDKYNLPMYNGTAHYVWGCELRKLSKSVEALNALKEAAVLLENTNENVLKGMIYFNIGLLYYNNENYNQSNFYYKKSLPLFRQNKNNKYMAYTFRAIFENLYQQHIKLDSIIYLLDLGIKYARESKDTVNYYNNLGRKGEVLFGVDTNLSKQNLLIAYNHLNPKPFHFAAFLANNYSKLNQYDSASFYLNIALNQKYDLKFKKIAFHAGANIMECRGNYKDACSFLRKSEHIMDSVYQKNIEDQLYIIDKRYDISQKEMENAELKISNRNKLLIFGTIVIFLLLIIILILLLLNLSRKRHAQLVIEKQRFENELSTRKITNDNKKELLLSKLQNKLENTVRLNQLKLCAHQQDKINAFFVDITPQLILSENEWGHYVGEVDKIFDNGITKLKDNNKILTAADLIVISLILLNVDIVDACIVLNMTKNTMYHRRRIIKERLNLEKEDDLDVAVKKIITDISVG